MFFPFDREKLKLLKCLKTQNRTSVPICHCGGESSGTGRQSYVIGVLVTRPPWVPPSSLQYRTPRTWSSFRWLIYLCPQGLSITVPPIWAPSWLVLSLWVLVPRQKKCKEYISTATNGCFLIIARKAVEAPMEQPPLTLHLSSHHILTSGPGLASLLPHQPSSVWAPLLRCPSSTWTRCLHNSPLTPPPV